MSFLPTLGSVKSNTRTPTQPAFVAISSNTTRPHGGQEKPSTRWEPARMPILFPTITNVGPKVVSRDSRSSGTASTSGLTPVPEEREKEELSRVILHHETAIDAFFNTLSPNQLTKWTQISHKVAQLLSIDLPVSAQNSLHRFATSKYHSKVLEKLSISAKHHQPQPLAEFLVADIYSIMPKIDVTNIFCCIYLHAPVTLITKDSEMGPDTRRSTHKAIKIETQLAVLKSLIAKGSAKTNPKIHERCIELLRPEQRPQLIKAISTALYDNDSDGIESIPNSETFSFLERLFDIPQGGITLFLDFDFSTDTVVPQQARGTHTI